VLWQVGDYTFNIWTQLSQEETIKVAKSIDVVR